jgi:hypothetical protein
MLPQGKGLAGVLEVKAATPAAAWQNIDRGSFKH